MDEKKDITLSLKQLIELYKKYCEDYKQIYGTYFVILSMETAENE